jgi:hypothetical protein
VIVASRNDYGIVSRTIITATEYGRTQCYYVIPHSVPNYAALVKARVAEVKKAGHKNVKATVYKVDATTPSGLR